MMSMYFKIIVSYKTYSKSISQRGKDKLFENDYLFCHEFNKQNS